MSEIFYTQDHEYLKIEGDVATVGVSDYAQRQLGDVVFVELPAKGAAVNQGEGMAVVESVKAANDVYAPISGEIIEINAALSDNPGLVNQAPLGDGWFAKMKIANPDELKALLSQERYDDYVKKL